MSLKGTVTEVKATPPRALHVPTTYECERLVAERGLPSPTPPRLPFCATLHNQSDAWVLGGVERVPSLSRQPKFDKSTAEARRLNQTLN